MPACTPAFIIRSLSAFLLLIGFLTRSTLAGPDGPDLRCPDYVIRYAPLVWLHSDDPYMPSDLLEHIRHTTPAIDGKPLQHLPPLDLDNLEILNDREDDVALTSNDDPLAYPPWLLGATPDSEGKVHNATPCVVIMVEKNQRDVDVFYFYFYSYNEGPNITQVLEPFNRMVRGKNVELGIHYGDHVGDWEHNMIRFRDGKPVGIYFSQHVDGAAYSWDSPKLTKSDGRPIVYSARGSHANYISTGKQIHNAVLVDYCDQGRKWDPILSAYFYRFDADSFTLTPLLSPNESLNTQSSSRNFTSFFYFKGWWGDIAYPDSDPRQDTVPRFGLKRFQSGPTGPRHKHLVRKGLKPDERRKMGWMEWSVGIYMSWYPCCIKGWRVWVSLGFLIAIFSGAVIGVVLGIRTYRTRRYRKLRVDDTELDDWVLEDDALLSSSDEDDKERNPTGKVFN
ncbi:putative vacuolar protein sorting-associated protein TDA6-like protein 1 [Colletotrichum chlorophyti]|uniref:Putative vacuolar protein sorting-associated protein TDA6-like protein 1 n=1 Tax=Colletotrichum chlorophyti TaxID=708187 RepID=A0A1Q8S8S5_9PEZI|nr:putative vacuolar protein sorting-associated protein TDA6-like protein 1 [Colletotrichum chlorophyti]